MEITPSRGTLSPHKKQKHAALLFTAFRKTMSSSVNIRPVDDYNSDTDNDEEETVPESVPSSPPKKRRGPGRPRKNAPRSEPTDATSTTSSSSSSTSSRRGKGRRPTGNCRIADSKRRNVTFCKRRAGLLKKAYELAVLCGADVFVSIQKEGKTGHTWQWAPKGGNYYGMMKSKKFQKLHAEITGYTRPAKSRARTKKTRSNGDNVSLVFLDEEGHVEARSEDDDDDVDDDDATAEEADSSMDSEE
jgi:hypothetical protein